jgi:hypothetical protein
LLCPADATAEGERRAGLAGKPDAVAQSLERRRLQAADAVFRGERLAAGAEDDDRERLFRRRLGAQLADAVEAERGWRRQQRVAQQLGRTGARRQPEQRDAGDDHEPAEAAARQQQPRADENEQQQRHRRQQQRGRDRLPRLDAERGEEAVHV